ncbi:hypothetical protein LJC05_04780, partial [Bacteroides sp. OttesenSCG-928-J23]|nr:hypothetical protein [Bacteroides sp. OttesenSCG-928-J23]
MKKRTYIFTIIAATILAACETHTEDTTPSSPATILATIPTVSTRADAAPEVVKTNFTPGDRITIQHQIGTAQQTTIATLNADGEW